jgi:2-amino-4-hydroxy-6-hydroxymethyldihydropteridine diphosphokinase
MPQNDIFVSLGANTRGCWGTPRDTLCRSVQELERCGINIVACSPVYLTPPHAVAGRMPAFYNAVVAIRANRAISSLLRLLQNIERRAGRRLRPRWSRRPLDLDIIDHGGRILNWPAPTRSGGPLILPHPLVHRRGFVLVPLAEIAPHWRHPVLGVSASELLARAPALRRGIVRVGTLGG